MKNKLFLGVDTSNYTTSLSLVKNGAVVKDVRRLLPVENGKCGLRQSDAVFFHTKALPELARELFDCGDYVKQDLCAVGVSASPRDETGSYMPCFLAGVSFASAISNALKIPLYSFSHQAGHISAAVSSCTNKELFQNGEFFAFHVSGGTTEALLCEYKSNTYSCKIVGGTLDASAGQIIDRAGVKCGLDFPCGRELDSISKNSSQKLALCVSMEGAYFHMSGLQNKFEKYIDSGIPLCDGAAFVFSSIAEALKRSLAALREQYGNKPCIFAGGVMCNSHIRQALSEINDVYFAEAALSCDNSVGTALLCEKQYAKEESN